MRGWGYYTRWYRLGRGSPKMQAVSLDPVPTPPLNSPPPYPLFTMAIVSQTRSRGPLSLKKSWHPFFYP
eukprot:762600-Hanusia_phi.AAC.2